MDLGIDLAAVHRSWAPTPSFPALVSAFYCVSWCVGPGNLFGHSSSHTGCRQKVSHPCGARLRDDVSCPVWKRPYHRRCRRFGPICWKISEMVIHNWITVFKIGRLYFYYTAQVPANFRSQWFVRLRKSSIQVEKRKRIGGVQGRGDLAMGVQSGPTVCRIARGWI